MLWNPKNTRLKFLIWGNLCQRSILISEEVTKAKVFPGIESPNPPSRLLLVLVSWIQGSYTIPPHMPVMSNSWPAWNLGRVNPNMLPPTQSRRNLLH